MWDMCQMLNIWHISHTKHKKSSQLDIVNVVKLFHLCPYRCKFATVWTDVVNQKLVFYSTFLSPLIFLFDFLSPFSESVSLSLLSSKPVLPLLTIGREQEEGGAEEGDGDGQERRKGSRNFVKIGNGGGGGSEFAERSGFDF